MRTSSSTASAGAAAWLRTASRPSHASATSKPSSRRIRSSASRTAGSSSTTRMRMDSTMVSDQPESNVNLKATRTA